MIDPFTPEEAEFLAEFTTVEIMPSAHLEELELIMETIPAMTPPLPVRVPLWLALNLRKSTGCQIIPPSWLNAATLGDIYTKEYSDMENYQTVPFHYMEIATLLLENIPNMPDAEKVRRLLQSIKEVRFRKTVAGLKAIDGNPLRINMLSFMEINEIRPFLLQAMDQASILTLLEAEERGNRQALYTGGVGAGKMGDFTGVGKGTLDSQDPSSAYPMPTSEDINPYSQTNNPYAYSSNFQ